MAKATKTSKKPRSGARKRSREDVNTESGANRTRARVLRKSSGRDK